MIAYNKTWLDNLRYRYEIEHAFFLNAITKEEKENAESMRPVGFYMPNHIIRVGLFILTLIIVSCSLGLLFQLIPSDGVYADSWVIILIGILSYVALEYFVQRKNHYCSGVDDASLWMSWACIVGGLNLMTDLSESGNALLIFVLSGYLFLRFADVLMSLIAVLSLIALIFYQYIRLGTIAQATIPFLLMIITAGIYFFARKISLKEDYRHYRRCFSAAEVIMLFSFYAAANYFIVREMRISMFDFTLKKNESIPFNQLFWFLTAVIPLAYILRGVHLKDRILIRVGLLLVAATVFTVRYYHSVLPLETAMVLGGVLLTVISYVLIKYLSEPKKGFTSKEIPERFSFENSNAEAILIAETFDGNPAPNTSHTSFGGGSFGGGGASGEY